MTLKGVLSLVNNGVCGDHFGVDKCVLRYETDHVAKMSIGVFHHGCQG